MGMRPAETSNFEDKALEFIIDLEAQCTPERRVECLEWLASDPRHRDAFLRMRELWWYADTLRTSFRRWRMVARFALVLGLAAALIAAIYLAMLPFAEGKPMSARSLAAHVLVPELLRAESLQELGRVTGYRYSAADGPKPSSIIATLTGSLPQAEMDERIRRYFLREGFTPSDDHLLTRKNEELSWSYLPEPSDEVRLEIALLTYMH